MARLPWQNSLQVLTLYFLFGQDADHEEPHSRLQSSHGDEREVEAAALVDGATHRRPQKLSQVHRSSGEGLKTQYNWVKK